MDKLYEKDIYLINPEPENNNKNYHACERTIMTRLAMYLARLMLEYPQFEDYSVDCEYNRNIYDKKNLPSFENGVYPDIIIHKRGNNDNNLAVIEIKTYWNKGQENDRNKIEEFTDLNGQYRYKYGILVMIAPSRDRAKTEVYQGGKQISV